ESKHLVREMELAGHLQARVPDVHAVKEGNDVEEGEKRDQPPADAADGTSAGGVGRQWCTLHSPKDRTRAGLCGADAGCEPAPPGLCGVLRFALVLFVPVVQITGSGARGGTDSSAFAAARKRANDGAAGSAN